MHNYGWSSSPPPLGFLALSFLCFMHLTFSAVWYKCVYYAAVDTTLTAHFLGWIHCNCSKVTYYHRVTIWTYGYNCMQIIVLWSVFCAKRTLNLILWVRGLQGCCGYNANNKHSMVEDNMRFWCIVYVTYKMMRTRCNNYTVLECCHSKNKDWCTRTRYLLCRFHLFCAAAQALS